MSSQNAFPGPKAGRPLARPATQTSNGQPSWVNPQPQQMGRPPVNSWPPQQEPAPAYPNFPQSGYQQPQPENPHAPAHGQWAELQHGGRSDYGYQGGAATGQPDPYAPQFEPYVPPSRPSFGQPQQPAPGYGVQPAQPQPQWPARNGDQRGYDQGNFGAPSYQAAQPQPAPTYGQQQYHENELSAADWSGPHDAYGGGYQLQHGDPNLGFGQAEGGDLEPVYNEDEMDYEDEEEAPRGRRPLLILAALVGAIVIGGGMAYGYKKMTGGGPAGTPPVVKSDDFAAKTKPADAGGKQFPYSDTKIMGRLGDGTSTAAADESNGSSAGTADSPTPAASAQDDGGPRKVSTLVVGRDGTIMPPATPTQDQDTSAPPPSGGTGVPGTALVDVFGQQGGNAPASSAPQQADNAQLRTNTLNDDAAPPVQKAKPVKVATVNAANSADDGTASPPPKKKLKKVARAEPTVETDATAAAPPVASSSGTGFVAVLASVPHSDSSRIDALKRFADMQQKYSTALSGKTPDIATATLAKGVYDRLVVGPPGSREQATSVCTELKAQGYHGCWVTSY